MKTSELTGKDLDTWVAKAQGWFIVTTPAANGRVVKWWSNKELNRIYRVSKYTPSTNGGQCFELLTIAHLSPSRDTWFDEDTGKIVWDWWYDTEYLSPKGWREMSGPTLNIAICRAFVASVYGEEIEV